MPGHMHSRRQHRTSPRTRVGINPAARTVVEAQEPRVLGILGRVHWRPGRGGLCAIPVASRAPRGRAVAGHWHSTWQAAVGAVRGVQRRAVAVAPAGACVAPQLGQYPAS
eukprot:3882285-Rhodomonas_salina.1